MSEPFDEDEECEAWRGAGRSLLVIEKLGRFDIAPLVPSI